MTKAIDPYSRVYWRVLDDPKFDAIRGDMRHFGSWTLMLLVADMAHPAPAFVPSSVPKRSLDALTAAGLVDLLAGGLYRVHGLAAERTRRSETGATNVSHRYYRGSTNPVLDETRLDETRQEETSTAGARAAKPLARGGPMLKFDKAMAAYGYKKP